MTRHRVTQLQPVDLDDTARLLSIRKVAELLCRSERFVRERIQAGELVAVTQGSGEGVMFVRLPDLKAYLDNLPVVVPRRAS